MRGGISDMEEIITLDYGSGGEKTSELIHSILLPLFDNPALAPLGDGAILSGQEQLAFSTDSFVVTPWRFPGGDIGKLAVCGTVNDLCMTGAVPRYLSFSLILEEGFLVNALREIAASAAAQARQAGVRIVTGDTKVVERGKGDGIYINTAGIGFLRASGLGQDAIKKGDAILLSGCAGCHGAAVLMARAGLADAGGPVSDCGSLLEVSQAALSAGAIRIMRDPTRGGVATVLAEFAEGTPLTMELWETAVPVDPAVAASCGLLGLDPLYSACEGRMVAIAAPEDAEAVLAAMRQAPGGEQAAIVGKVTDRYPGSAVLNTALGGRRLLPRLTGAQLPRIC